MASELNVKRGNTSPLTYWERKQRLPHGAVSAVARDLAVGVPFVSMVLKGTKRHFRVEAALCAQMRPRLGVARAFGPVTRRTAA